MADQISKTPTFFKKYRFVILTLSVSALLRWVLIFRGGQFYFPDESRYGIARDATTLLVQGKLRSALLTLINDFEHLGFKITALIPALVEKLLHSSPVIPAIFFSLFSLLNVLLIWKIAQKTGEERIARYAILLAACSQVLLYYSRHLLPYDQGMFFGLLTLYFALREPATMKHSFLCGALGFFCLLTYNGYWPLAGFGMAVDFFYGTKEQGWFWKRTLFLGLGFLLPLVLLLGISYATGSDFFSSYRSYIQTITQGAFNEGWSLPFAYLWHAEHGFFVILGLFAGLTLFRLKTQGSKTSRLGLVGIVFIYLCLVISSNLTHSFVVYGRLARQLMPFLIFAAAGTMGFLASQKRWGTWLVNSLVVIVLVQSLWNYYASYVLVYPREFVQRIQAGYPEFNISSKMMQFYAPLVCQNNGFLAINLHYIYDWPQRSQLPREEVLSKALHPVNFFPYQYEGYTPEQREDLRRQHFEMIFSRLDVQDHSNATTAIENCYQEK